MKCTKQYDYTILLHTKEFKLMFLLLSLLYEFVISFKITS